MSISRIGHLEIHLEPLAEYNKRIEKERIEKEKIMSISRCGLCTIKDCNIVYNAIGYLCEKDFQDEKSKAITEAIEINHWSEDYLKF